jgi:hypothetical protein
VVPPNWNWPAAWDATYPPARNYGAETAPDGCAGIWAAHLLPYLEQEALFQRVRAAGTLPFQVAPTLAACQNLTCQTGHPGATQVGLGDGSARAVSGSISAATWRTACNDPQYAGQVLGPDW